MAGHDVAITGIGATTPLGGDVASTWEGLLAGRSGVRRIDELLPDPEAMPVRIAAPLAVSPADLLPPVQARRLDRCQQSAMVAAAEAWADAGKPEVDPLRLAVVLGTGIGGMQTLLEQHDILNTKGPARVSPLTVPKLMANGTAGWLSLEYGAKAGVYTTVSACASGAEAIAHATRLLRAGEVDMVIAGGTESVITPVTVAAFAQARTLSKRNDDPERASRPFDADRDGFVLGEGAGVLILERTEFATARNARILGHVAGYGVTADAYHITGPDPEGAGQIEAMRKAVGSAGLTPADVTHVNCHATSTVVGDTGETAAIRRAIGDHAVLTAPKSSIGHLVGAAGAVEAIITLLTLREGRIPPTLNLENQDPAIPLDIVSGEPRPHSYTTALTNSFGFGGQNVSLVLTSA